MQYLIILPNDRVEDGPHDLGKVDFTLVVANVQAEDYLVKLALVNVQAFVAKRRWQIPQEISELSRIHIVISRLVKLAPSIEENLNVTLLQREDIERVLRHIHILELLIYDGNKDIDEYEEGEQLEGCPVEVRYRSFGICTVMHDLIPALARG